MLYLQVSCYTFGGNPTHSENSHCSQVLPWQPFVKSMLENGKVKKLAYLEGYLLDIFCSNLVQGVFLDFKSKTSNKIFI